MVLIIKSLTLLDNKLDQRDENNALFFITNFGNCYCYLHNCVCACAWVWVVNGCVVVSSVKTSVLIYKSRSPRGVW